MARPTTSLACSSVAIIFLAASLLSGVRGHGYAIQPRPRGAMAGEKIVDLLTELMPGVPKTCIDYSSHFPAGDKRRIPGIGLKSQIAAAGSGGYGPYNPTELLLSSGQALHPCLVRISTRRRLRSRDPVRHPSQRLYGVPCM